jgi:hypothetical protein
MLVGFAALAGSLIIIKCLMVLSIGKWFDYSCRDSIPRILLFAPYLIEKKS